MSFKLYQICYTSLFFVCILFLTKCILQFILVFQSHAGDVNVSKRHVSGKVYIYVRPLLVSMVAVPQVMWLGHLSEFKLMMVFSITCLILIIYYV